MSIDPNQLTILDAGMGKTLSMRGVEIPSTIWSANALLTAPDVVVDIHKENIAADANIITTNSYGVIRSDLAKVGQQDRTVELNQLAGTLAQQAREESNAKVSIAGSLPPLNGSYRPDLVLDTAELLPLYREQVAALVDFVDLFICETMSHSSEAVAAVTAATESGKPVIVAFTLHDEEVGQLKSGERLEEVVFSLAKYDLAGTLVNCCLPERITDAMPLLVEVGAPLRGGYGNAFTKIPRDWLLGGEKETDGRLQLRDDLDPERYSGFVSQWVKKGANIVGGCCGTTAEHTKAISRL